MARGNQDRWAVVEIVGHRRLAGRISADRSTGIGLLRVVVPAVEVNEVRQRGAEHGWRYERCTFTIPEHCAGLFGPMAVFCVSDGTEAMVRTESKMIGSTPVHWTPAEDDMAWEPIPECSDEEIPF